MIEKIDIARVRRHTYPSGYFKPKGKTKKRMIHKKIRRIADIPIHSKGIYNRIGVEWFWS